MRIFYDKDADLSLLKDKTIAIIGYGIQGRGQSLCLRDSGCKVVISELESKQSTVLEIKVAKEDIGKIIGKQGRTAQAIRTILNAASAKVKKRTIMKIID